MQNYVYIWVNYVFGHLYECTELALVKNTERWVSLPSIQTGNLGDLRNVPTWNTNKEKKNVLNKYLTLQLSFHAQYVILQMKCHKGRNFSVFFLFNLLSGNSFKLNLERKSKTVMTTWVIYLLYCLIIVASILCTVHISTPSYWAMIKLMWIIPFSPPRSFKCVTSPHTDM